MGMTHIIVSFPYYHVYEIVSHRGNLALGAVLTGNELNHQLLADTVPSGCAKAISDFVTLQERRNDKNWI